MLHGASIAIGLGPHSRRSARNENVKMEPTITESVFADAGHFDGFTFSRLKTLGPVDQPTICRLASWVTFKC